MPSSSRKFHTKSRNGCLPCKKLRKKCDERPPCCSRCQRRGTRCTFEDLGWSGIVVDVPAIVIEEQTGFPRVTLAVRSNMTSESLKSGLDTSAAKSKLHPDLVLSPQDLRFLSHFATSTSSTITSLSPAGSEPTWTEVVNLETDSHSFLMHIILAISALHCAYLIPKDSAQYAWIAHDHNAKALTLFRSSVSRITKENGVAILSFAFLQILFCLGSPLVPHRVILADPIDGFCETLSALRGFFQLQPAVYAYVGEEGITAAWLRHERTSRIIVSDDILLQRILELHELNEASTHPECDKDVCRRAISSLQQFSAEVSTQPLTWEAILAWLLTITEEFSLILKQRNPVALIILSHWCVPIHHASSQWFLNSWGDKIIRSVAQMLSPEWLLPMQWPLNELERTRRSPSPAGSQYSGLLETPPLEDISTSGSKSDIHRTDSIPSATIEPFLLNTDVPTVQIEAPLTFIAALDGISHHMKQRTQQSFRKAILKIRPQQSSTSYRISKPSIHRPRPTVERPRTLTRKRSSSAPSSCFKVKREPQEADDNLKADGEVGDAMGIRRASADLRGFRIPITQGDTALPPELDFHKPRISDAGSSPLISYQTIAP